MFLTAKEFLLNSYCFLSVVLTSTYSFFFLRYNEVCDPGYDFERSSWQGDTGHFTQVVWKGSTVLGIGKADGQRNGLKCTYYVARYKPAGNVAGQMKQNVLKGSFQQSYCATVNAFQGSGA